MLQYWRDACKVVNPQSEDNTESTLPAKFQIAVLGRCFKLISMCSYNKSQATLAFCTPA